MEAKIPSFYFPFISLYFSESGLFKGLQPKEIKKSEPVSERAWFVQNA